MTAMSQPLPEFGNPPVVEVALSVQFETLASLRTPQLGLLWQQFRDRFPKIEEHPPLDAQFERFGVRSVPEGVVQFQMLAAPPVPRCWFLNSEGTELVQVQQDRFVHNWRKVGDHHYPRYERVRQTFESELMRFAEFLSHEHVGEFSPNQCEITYVNHVTPGEAWTTHGQLADILTFFSPQYSDTFQPVPEDAKFSARFVIPNGGIPLGRLHVAVEPVFSTADNLPLFAIILTARGRPVATGVPGVLGFLDIGRDWIVRTFASITTPKMHKVWRRTR